MSRVLLVTTPEKGHVNPMAGVARWLIRNGHTTAWLCLPEPSEQVNRLGVEQLRLSVPVAGPGIPMRGEQIARIVRDRQALAAWIRSLLLDAVPDLVEPVREAIRRWQPDVIGLDPMLYAAVLAAHLEHVPYAGISSSLNPVTPDSFDCPHQRNMRALHQDRQALFARYGLAPTFRVADCLSPWLNTVFATEAYVSPLGDLPPATHLVGPSIPPDIRGDETDLTTDLASLPEPFVYASFGSQIYHQPEAFGLLAEVCAQMGVALVISGGDLAGSSFAASLPGNTLVVRYAPQLALLERASVMVTHGGANSVMEALRAGVPLLVSPVCNDQPIQAAFVTASGAGMELDLYRASPQDCQAVLSALLAPHSSCRQAASRIRDSYRSRDGARMVAQLLADLAP